MDVMHAATLSADASAMHLLEPVRDLTVLAARRHEIEGAARGLEAPLVGAGNACSATIGGHDADMPEFGADLAKPGIEAAGQTAAGSGFGAGGG